MKICFASHNPNKLKEIRQMMPSGNEVVSLDELGVHEEIDETGKTLEENALIKAQHVFEKFKVPVFADDSGLEVEFLDGAPGVYSARYAGPQKNSEDNMDLLLSNLGDSEKRSACFKSVISFINEKGESQLFEGRVDGRIIKERRGDKGFGYDPIFIPEGHDRTFAQMTDDEKNSMSHRARALKKFINYLSEQ